MDTWAREKAREKVKEKSAARFRIRATLFIQSRKLGAFYFQLALVTLYAVLRQKAHLYSGL